MNLTTKGQTFTERQAAESLLSQYLDPGIGTKNLQVSQPVILAPVPEDIGQKFRELMLGAKLPTSDLTLIYRVDDTDCIRYESRKPNGALKESSTFSDQAEARSAPINQYIRELYIRGYVITQAYLNPQTSILSLWLIDPTGARRFLRVL